MMKDTCWGLELDPLFSGLISLYSNITHGNTLGIICGKRDQYYIGAEFKANILYAVLFLQPYEYIFLKNSFSFCYHFFFACLFYFGTISGDVQGLLCTQIIPGGFGIWNAGYRTHFSHMEEKRPICCTITMAWVLLFPTEDDCIILFICF